MTTPISGKRLWAGIMLLLIGSFYLAYNFNLLPFEVPSYVFTWPVILILFGVYALYKSWFKGFILIAIGTYFLLPKMGAIPAIDFMKAWPALLILLGLTLLFGARFKKKTKKKHFVMNSTTAQINEETFDITAIMGGDARQINSYNFKGGKITAIMGGLELDLSNCHLAKEGCVIDLSVVMGGISLKISREWNIKSEILPIMSGIEDNVIYKEDNYIDPAALIVLRGTIVMGGVEIKRT